MFEFPRSEGNSGSPEKRILECLDPSVWTSDFAIFYSLMRPKSSGDEKRKAGYGVARKGDPEADLAFDIFAHSGFSAMHSKISTSSYDQLSDDQVLRVSSNYEFAKAELEAAVLEFREKFGHLPASQMANQVMLTDMSQMIDSDPASDGIKYWMEHQNELEDPLLKLRARALARVGWLPSLKRFRQWQTVSRQITSQPLRHSEMQDGEPKEWLKMLSASGRTQITDCRNLVFYRLRGE